MAGVGSVVGFSLNPIEFTIRVHFTDGSTALYTYNHTTQTWDRLKGHSRDSNNNIIPETPETVAGGGVGTTVIYSFAGNNGNLIDFVYQLTLLGVPISGPTSNRTTIVCVSTSAGTMCHSEN